jgi:L-rhamnose-H+ transport protein
MYDIGGLSTVFIYGMGSSAGLLQATAATGTMPVYVGCVAMAVTFTTGAVANLIYCLYLLSKNRTFSCFATSGSLVRNVSLSFLMGALWYFALLMYGVSTVKMAA